MKTRCHRTVCSALTVALAAGLAHAQAINESFDDVEFLTANGWYMQNNSEPLGSIGWFQGTLTVFEPVASPGYIGANYNNGSGAATISNWLLTPETTISNGSQLRFWTRSADSQWPDRLEVRMSSTGASTNVGVGAFDVGDFTTLLLEINPAQLQGVYLNDWVLYTVDISGLGAPVQGRIAFRYHVVDAGPSGNNSDYIGIDEVQFSTGPIPTGACVLTSTCRIVSAHECTGLGGVYQGNNSNCPSLPPGVYEWVGNVAIPDGTGTASCGIEGFAEIVVPENQTINGITVGVQVNHTWQGDVKFAVHHVESNTTVQLVDRPGVSPSSTYGFSSPNYGDGVSLMRFLDTATSTYSDPPIPDPGIANVTGDWLALSPMSAFVGQDSGGTWRLIAQDCAGGDTGALRVFRLELDLGGTGPLCYANCDESTTPPILNVDDFTCFINEFAQAQALPYEQQVAAYANCDGSTTPPVLNVDDFTCFINEFAQGCP